MNPALETFAWRVAGPIDFVINLIINAACPFIFLGVAGTIPLFGVPSVAIFLAPMFFCVLVFATFFGYRNGIIQRNLGNGGPRLPESTPWVQRAILLGLLYALIGQGVIWGILLALRWFSPEQRWSVVQLAIVDGLAAGILGYFTQINGIRRANAFNP